jgi:dTDP-4-dehydrorhamnose 3,5-epimerase
MSFNANIYSSKIFPDVTIFEPSVGKDIRGTIFTTYDKKIYSKYLPDNLEFIHDKFAESRYNVLRGLHGDNKTWKLVSCLYGEIFQVIADIRPDSKTYLKWESWILNSDNKLQILIPPGFVNGYYVKSKKALFHYKLAYEGKYFDVEEQIVVKWNDPRLNIKWPYADPILSERDK